MRKRILLSLFCGLVGLSAVVQADAPRYRVTKIVEGTQTSWGHYTAYALNNKGDVVGQAGEHAFVWHQGQLTLLELPKDSKSGTASDINDSGQIVGVYAIESLKKQYFFWHGGKIQNLGDAPWGIGVPHIDADGQVLIPSLEQHTLRAIYWKNGQKKDGGAIVSYSFYDSSQTARMPGIGSTLSGGDDLVHWGILREESQTDSTKKRRSLSTLIYNKRGYVVSDYPAISPRHYWLVQDGKSTDITPKNILSLIPYALNEKNRIVGTMEKSAMKFNATLWQDGQWYDLNDCIEPDSGWVLTHARDINEQGQIVGSGTHNGMTCAFLLTPIS